MKSLRQRIQELIDALPDDADAIADVMREGRFRGFKTNSSACPLAQYVKQVGAKCLSVGPLGVFWAGDELVFANVPLPHGALDFIARFDQDEYPDLVMDHSEVGAYV